MNDLWVITTHCWPGGLDQKPYFILLLLFSHLVEYLVICFRGRLYVFINKVFKILPCVFNYLSSFIFPFNILPSFHWQTSMDLWEHKLFSIIAKKNLSHDQNSLLLGFKLKFLTCIFVCFIWVLPPLPLPLPPLLNPGLGWQFTASSISCFQGRVLTDASHQLTARALCRCRKFEMRYEII